MGAWGVRAFDNDTAGDWSYGLEEVDDLSLIEAALEMVEDAGDEDLDQDQASEARAACEVLARLLGRPSHKDSYTETADEWVAAHPITPPAMLLQRARACIARILGEASELRELWDDSENGASWRAAVQDLDGRLAP